MREAGKGYVLAYFLARSLELSPEHERHSECHCLRHLQVLVAVMDGSISRVVVSKMQTTPDLSMSGEMFCCRGPETEQQSSTTANSQG